MTDITLFVVGCLSGLTLLLIAFIVTRFAFKRIRMYLDSQYNKDAEKRELRKNLNDNNMYKQYGRQPYNWETGEK